MRIFQVFFVVIIFFFWILPLNVLAQNENSNQFVNIVNPVRISSYTKNPGVSLEAQYLEVKKRDLPATWLLTYGSISDDGVVSVAKSMNQTQELGLFLEVEPQFAKDAGVDYSKTDSWHRANAVFLSGYTQEERRKLIDTIFEKFKSLFGYYPVSVGAWWVDSYSLEYMQNIYHITANLTCADQFSTDGYQLWGQFFGIPFYPSKFHAGIPAVDASSKLNVVTIQWAPRDPLNGYGRGPASLFSTQDYFTLNLGDDYFQKLVNFYTKKGNNRFGQVTVGLEGDLTPEAYSAQFSRQLEIILNLKNQGIIEAVSMRKFADWYKSNFPATSPSHIFETDDLLGKKIKTIWYQSPSYRVHLTYDYENKETKILDLRFYYDNFQEPFYISPNRNLNLFINVPSVIDSVENEDEAWTVTKEELDQTKVENGNLLFKYKNGDWIKLSERNLVFSGKINQSPDMIKKSPSVKFTKQGNTFSILSTTRWVYPQEGLLFRALTPEATNFLRQRKVVLIEILIAVSFITSLFFLGKKGIAKNKKVVAFMVVIFVISGIIYWYKLNSRNYFVPQAELDALVRLSAMPGRKVVVFDKVCLQCAYHTKYLPAVFADKRHYVSTVSKKEIVYNSKVFNAKTREEARRELAQLKADYIYVVKFENYVERVPFSPGDLNLEEIYSNANATVWRIKKN